MEQQRLNKTLHVAFSTHLYIVKKLRVAYREVKMMKNGESLTERKRYSMWLKVDLARRISQDPQGWNQ